MTECVGCGFGEVELLHDFGLQPPSNRFVTANDALGDRHRLAMGQCQDCGLLQLIAPMPVDMVRPRFEWLAYSEPEGHLDALVARLLRLPGLNRRSRIAGLTYKDDSTITRFNKLGFQNTYRVDPQQDLEILDPCAGLETIQEAVSEPRMRAIAERHGPVDLLIVRHVLEHSHSPRSFVAGLARLLRPSGYLVFEIPDCTKFVGACDHSFVWEEHISYFAPSTLKRFIAGSDFLALDELTFPYAFEDSLITVATPRPSRSVLARRSIEPPAPEEFELARKFGQSFTERLTKTRAALEAASAAGRQVAVFGAGHLAARFVNFFRLNEFLSCAIDDNPKKQGLRMPGSGLSIVGPSVLAEGRVDLCLLSLSPESERNFLARQAQFIARGGEFRSIFALSPIALVAPTA